MTDIRERLRSWNHIHQLATENSRYNRGTILLALAETIAEIERLRVDAERLDYLDAIISAAPDGRYWMTCLPGGLRYVIDRAIASTTKGEP